LIVEALRSGVEINSLPSFSDIDDFAQLRMHNDLSRHEKVQYILNALSQVGKKYDFGFDIESSQTIVCSELHYRVFQHIPFRTTKILGRFTIDVDQVAEQAVGEKFLKPISLYIAGKKIDHDKIQARFESLIKSHHSSDYTPVLIDLKNYEDFLNMIGKIKI